MEALDIRNPKINFVAFGITIQSFRSLRRFSSRYSD